VISGVGTRHYYRKLGYDLDGPHMNKLLIEEDDDDKEEEEETKQ